MPKTEKTVAIFVQRGYDNQGYHNNFFCEVDAVQKREMPVQTDSGRNGLRAIVIPVILANILLVLFSFYDGWLQEWYAGSYIADAIRDTTTLIALLVMFNLIVGAAVAANRMAVKRFRRKGAANAERKADICSLVVGFFAALVGVTCSVVLLKILNCPSKYIAISLRYVRMTIGAIALLLVCNFCIARRLPNMPFKTAIAVVLAGCVLKVLIAFLLVVIVRLNVLGASLGTVSAIAAVLLILLFVTRKHSAEKNKTACL